MYVQIMVRKSLLTVCPSNVQIMVRKSLLTVCPVMYVQIMVRKSLLTVCPSNACSDYGAEELINSLP